MEINHLDFDVTGTCSSQMYEEDVKLNKPTEYGVDCLTDNAEFDNFRCPECDEVICLSEEEAIKFLEGKDE